MSSVMLGGKLDAHLLARTAGVPHLVEDIIGSRFNMLKSQDDDALDGDHL
jgi:hypothetical protein